MWAAAARARLGSKGNRGKGKGGESGSCVPGCRCSLDDAASTVQPRRCSLGDKDREEVAPPRSLASGVAQRARGSNPGRTVVCLRPCEGKGGSGGSAAAA